MNLILSSEKEKQAQDGIRLGLLFCKCRKPGTFIDLHIPTPCTYNRACYFFFQLSGGNYCSTLGFKHRILLRIQFSFVSISYTDAFLSLQFVEFDFTHW